MIIVGSAYSQKVISSVNVNKSVETVSKHLNKQTKAIHIDLKHSENWMQNKNYLETSSSLESYKMQLVMFEKVIEKERSIENWMLNEKYWKINNPEPSDIVDQVRKIEDWMLDKSFWKIKDEPDRMDIEGWMFNDEFWVMVN